MPLEEQKTLRFSISGINYDFVIYKRWIVSRKRAFSFSGIIKFNYHMQSLIILAEINSSLIVEVLSGYYECENLMLCSPYRFRLPSMVWSRGTSLYRISDCE